MRIDYPRSNGLLSRERVMMTAGMDPEGGMTLSRVRSVAGLGGLVVLRYVPGEAPLAGLLPAAGLWRATDYPAPASRIRRRDYRDWDDYQKVLRGGFRRELRRRMRRLQERGDVEIGMAR